MGAAAVKTALANQDQDRGENMSMPVAKSSQEVYASVKRLLQS